MNFKNTMKKSSLIFFGLLISISLLVFACSEDAVGRPTPSQQKYLDRSIKCVDPDAPFNATSATSRFESSIVTYTLKGKRNTGKDRCILAPYNATMFPVNSCDSTKFISTKDKCFVREYYCADEYKIDSVYLECPGECKNGACVNT